MEIQIPKATASFFEKNIIPFCVKDAHYYFFSQEPPSLALLDEIKFYTDLKPYPICVASLEFQAIKNAYFKQKNTAMLLDNIHTDEAIDSHFYSSDDNPLISFLSFVFEMAISEGATDIHFEPYETHYRIRMRIDSFLEEKFNLPLTLSNPIAQRIKMLANLDITEHYIPQNGQFSHRSQHNHIEFRVASCPTLFGEKVALRLLHHQYQQTSLENLGLWPSQVETIHQYLAKKSGLILVTGPTGAGKTKTLYTLLSLLNSVEKNILTLEDPVEMKLEGINQVSLQTERTLKAADFLKAFLRQDPDILMIGEIRDEKTAELVFKASQTGHLVLSTLHTQNASMVPHRLKSLGISPHLIQTHLNLVIAQRLVRKSCPLDINAYDGLIGIFEFLEIKPHFNLSDDLTTYIYPTLQEAGLKLVQEHKTTQEELHRVL